MVMTTATAPPTPDGGAGTGAASHAADRSRAYFQYVGRTAATVTGGVTGARYHFARPGAVVPVDPRDRRSVSQVPVLRQVATPS
jgi:hypothetical protein